MCITAPFYLPPAGLTHRGRADDIKADRPDFDHASRASFSTGRLPNQNKYRNRQRAYTDSRNQVSSRGVPSQDPGSRRIRPDFSGSRPSSSFNTRQPLDEDFSRTTGSITTSARTGIRISTRTSTPPPQLGTQQAKPRRWIVSPTSSPLKTTYINRQDQEVIRSAREFKKGGLVWQRYS